MALNASVVGRKSFEMLPNQIRYILNFADVFGYNSGISKLSRNQRNAQLIYFVHVAMAIFYAYYLTIYTINYPSELPPIEMVNTALQYFSAFFAYLFVVFDSVFYGCQHRSFWQHFGRVNKLHADFYEYSSFCLILKFTIYVAVRFVCLLAFVIENDNISDLAIFLFLITLLVKICEMRVFYYIFCVDVLHSRLKAIDNELKSIERKNSVRISSSEIKRIRTRYNSIFEMSNLLNEVFGLSQVTAISYCFYIVLTEINYLLAHSRKTPAISTVGKI